MCAAPPGSRRRFGRERVAAAHLARLVPAMPWLGRCGPPGRSPAVVEGLRYLVPSAVNGRVVPAGVAPPAEAATRAGCPRLAPCEVPCPAGVAPAGGSAAGGGPALPSGGQKPGSPRRPAPAHGPPGPPHW